MKTKKDVIAAVGLVLFILAVTMLGDFDNFVSSSEVGLEDSYDEIVADIDESLMKTYSNNDKIKSLNGDLEMYRDNLTEVLEDYVLLKKEIDKISENIERVEDEVNKTKADSDKLKDRRIRLQDQLEGSEEEESSGVGVKAWLFYLSLFISVNLFIWFEISTYYREKNFHYGKY